MFNYNFFSAADLVKKSAAQIKYLRDKQERIYNARIARGVQHQKKVVEKLQATEELRSLIEIDDIVIFASHDLLTDDYIAEIKNVEGEYEDWYLQSSLLQAAFYKAILIKSGGFLKTPSFRIKEGYPVIKTKVETSISYKLFFGEEIYEIIDVDTDALINYFLNKAKETYDYDRARAFDYKHKFKHYEELKTYFKVIKIK